MSTESQKKEDKSKKDPDKNVSVNTEKDTGKSLEDKLECPDKLYMV